MLEEAMAVGSSITRTFLGFDSPGLVAATKYLMDRFTQGDVCDLSGVIVVVPGRRAGRRLLELIVATAHRRHLLLTPPVIETVGRVAEHLYTAKREFANDLTQQLAWERVLREADEEASRTLLPKRPDDDSPKWFELAGLLRRQHIELAAEGLNFSDVAWQVEEVGGAEEASRWEAMATMQAAYHGTLDGLSLWDRQTARLKAIEFGECKTERSIVLVATVDMNVSLTNMLDQIPDRVASLVLAPKEWGERFDEYGGLISACWQDVMIDIDDRAIEVVDRPRDQANAVVRHLASYEGHHHVDDITIGVPNEQLLGELERQLQQVDVPCRWGPGTSLRESSPFRLLAVIADFLAHQRFSDFAQLVRHVDIDDWLVAAGAEPWLTELDRYQAAHLPYRVPKTWLGLRKNSPLRFVSGKVADLLAALADRSQRLDAWREPLKAVLGTVYKNRRFSQTVATDRLTFKACSRFIEALDEHAAVPDSLMPKATAEEAIRMAMQVMARDQMPADASESIELLGWLELVLDDAPALIVTGLNEGVVPESVNSDLFMPNALRTRIGLLDNPRRYARDAYALQVLLKTRESFHLIVGRRTLDGDPLLPSRLLFATSAEKIAVRARRFFSTAQDDRPLPISSVASEESERKLEIPPPAASSASLSELRVTGFRDFLACPYRFYLRHVLRLEALDDNSDELDGGSFGVAAHEVLRRFGDSRRKDSTDPLEIQRFLDGELNDYAKGRYGGDAMPAVRVQVEQLRLRLEAFATWQANRAAEGWQIEYVESGETQSVPFEVDGIPLLLRGRIDRIDHHPSTGRRMILDYKTSDLPKSPEKSHQHRSQWTDLQLPLYRHLATALDLKGPFELAYILLPRDTSKLDLSVANWSEAQLSSADDAACEVIRKIRRHEFWPPTDPAPEFSAEFAAICQDGVLR